MGICVELVWPHRLTARTSDSHSGNRGSIPREVTNEKVFWEKENRGEEARIAKQEGRLPVIDKESNSVSEGTAYKGHHIMRCTVKQNGRIFETLEFGIFIKG